MSPKAQNKGGRPSKSRLDNAVVTITLVPHGYQFDWALYHGKEEVVGGRQCRDFDGNIKNMEAAVQKILDAVGELA